MLQDTRDVVLIIFSITGTLFFLLVIFAMLAAGLKIRALARSASDALAKAGQLIQNAKDAIRPIAQIIGIIEAVSKGFDLASKIFGKNKGGTEHEQGRVD